MLLRRVIEHLDTQNWTAVFLDFLIVVVGVFIGIQVANWNGERAAISAENRLVEQLQADFTDLRADLVDEIGRLKSHQEKVTRLLDLVYAGEVPEEDEIVSSAILAALSPPAPSPPPLSFIELQSSGGLSLIRDAKLRRALSAYGQAVSRFANYIPLAIRDASNPESPLLRSIQFSTEQDAFRTGRILDRYDVAAIEKAGPELQVLLAWAWNGESAAQAQKSAAELVLQAISDRSK